MGQVLPNAPRRADRRQSESKARPVPNSKTVKLNSELYLPARVKFPPQPDNPAHDDRALGNHHRFPEEHPLNNLSPHHITGERSLGIDGRQQPCRQNQSSR